jgi:hypothetical protein
MIVRELTDATSLVVCFRYVEIKMKGTVADKIYSKCRYIVNLPNMPKFHL